MSTPESDRSHFDYKRPNVIPDSAYPGALKVPAIDRLGAIIDEERKAYIQSIRRAAPDLNALVYEYVTGLFQKIEERIRAHGVSERGNFEAAVRNAIAEQGKEIYFSAGRDVLGPLVTRFVTHIFTHAPRGATVAFLARDAEPYYEAAKVLSEQSEFRERDLHPRYVTLNRHHLRIYDENLNREQSKNLDPRQDELRDRYLKQEMFDNPNGVVIVDTGCWGTMIEKLWNAMATKGSHVLNLREVYFMYSHNPGIYGYVNHVGLQEGAFELAAQSVFIGDTFECLPKREESSTEFTMRGDGVVEPIRKPLSSVYLAAWNEGVLGGIRASAKAFIESPRDFPTAGEALALMEKNRMDANRKFTGVLPQATPKWSDGEAFLRGWKLAPVPPRHQTDSEELA